MTANDPFSDVRYHVDAAAAQAITDGDQHAAGHRREFEQTLRSYLRRHLDRRPGYFVLSGLDGLTEAQAREFALATSRTVGELLPQDGAGAILREVRDRGVRIGDDATARYSDSRHGGNLHTDAAHRPGRLPDCFTLFCLRPAARGGALVTVHVDDLLEILREHPDVLETLQLPVHFDTRDDSPGTPPTTQRPILDLSGSHARMYYLREYIELGHRHEHVPALTPAQVDAMDFLDTLLDRRDLQVHGRLASGEMIFIDNRSIVHGRTEFEDDRSGAGGRLLLRTWIAMP
ncbi:TauD/TfdA family dioxygenase [Nocardia sp. NPDC020380]|uniref:TauD/TfdA family dioxygenase n=1 Tax=Nocardia sp. NPDC020380 TaxID=3364309 RepID=UPI00378D9195